MHELHDFLWQDNITEPWPRDCLLLAFQAIEVGLAALGHMKILGTYLIEPFC